MDTILLGPVSRDVYLQEGRILPGGGCLNIAYHWRQLDFPFLFITRTGDMDGRLFTDFCNRHQIPFLENDIHNPGRSAAIDVIIQEDGQPWMKQFVPGVWADFRLKESEMALLPRARRLHTVLVEGMIREIERLGAAGMLEQLELSADFLDFRHMTPARFAALLTFIDIAFIGWPGPVDDPALDELAAIAAEKEGLLVITLGSRGVRVVDGRAHTTHFFPVTPLPVRGTTIGCGDTFIGYFLARYWTTGDIRSAVAQGKTGGGMATRWRFPLPPEAYDE